jgi:hypothetical protein
MQIGDDWPTLREQSAIRAQIDDSASIGWAVSREFTGKSLCSPAFPR